jgi:hypothetical protein
MLFCFNQDSFVQKSSSSGGVFYSLAQEVIKEMAVLSALLLIMILCLKTES